MNTRNISLGKRGEKLAEKFLKKQGFSICARNYRTRCGEIDIIAREKGVLVFVEVKTRSGMGYGLPAEAITPNKQKQISKAALEYLEKHKLFDCQARFDVVAVIDNGTDKAEVELIRNAFDLRFGY